MTTLQRQKSFALSLRGERAALAARDVRASGLTEDSLELAEACQAECNAFSTITHAAARRGAAESDARYAIGSARLLEGLPLAVKDMFDTASIETRYGSLAYVGHVPTGDAALVGTLLGHGMVLVGKTTTHEFAWGVTTDSEAFGPTRNPLDVDRIPGGSSGGMAAAVAYGVVAAGLGTDTGGSVRIPAALCGVVGFKPGRGVLPVTGIFPLSATLDHAGVIGRTVDDVMMIMTGLGLECGATDPHGAVVAFVDAPGGLEPSAEVGERFRRALDVIGGIAQVRRAEGELLPAEAFGHFATIVLAEGGMRHFALSTPQQRRDSYDPETIARLEMAERVTLLEYAHAQDARRLLSANLDEGFLLADYIVTPTVPCVAPKIGTNVVEIGEWSGSIREALMTYTAPFNLSGHPAISLPLPTPPGGLPVGIQIVGRRGEDAGLLRFALQVEKVLAVKLDVLATVTGDLS